MNLYSPSIDYTVGSIANTNNRGLMRVDHIG